MSGLVRKLSFWGWLPLGAIACGGGTSAGPEEMPNPGTPPPGLVSLTIQANISAAQVASVTVEVSGPGIDPPITINLSITGGIAQGTVTVPAGSDRTFTVRAFDANGVETHRGSVTRTVTEGSSDSFAVTLEPLNGQVEISVTIGTLAVTIAPDTATLTVGDTLSFVATATDVEGMAVTNPQFIWASSNSAFVSVSDSGTATALKSGAVTVVVSYQGVAAAATVTVP